MPTRLSSSLICVLSCLDSALPIAREDEDEEATRPPLFLGAARGKNWTAHAQVARSALTLNSGQGLRESRGALRHILTGHLVGHACGQSEMHASEIYLGRATERASKGAIRK